MPPDSADCNLARLSPHCSFVAVAAEVIAAVEDNSAVAVGKFEFLVVDYLAFGDDVAVVEDVVVE